MRRGAPQGRLRVSVVAQRRRSLSRRDCGSRTSSRVPVHKADEIDEVENRGERGAITVGIDVASRETVEEADEVVHVQEGLADREIAVGVAVWWGDGEGPDRGGAGDSMARGKESRCMGGARFAI